MNNNLFGINRDIILRKEIFGGTIFNKRTAVTIQLDKEAFNLVKLFIKPKPIEEVISKIRVGEKKKKEALNIINTLFTNDIITNDKNKILIQYDNRILDMPQVVHLSITSECNLNCPSCFRNVNEPEMSKEQLFKLIDELHSLKIFQLAIGGGEPFLYENLFDILEYAKDKIVCNITTNGIGINKDNILRLKELVGQINISLNRRTFQIAINAIKLLMRTNLQFGVNVLVSRRSIKTLNKLLEYLKTLGVKRIVILRPKPTVNSLWYKNNSITDKHIIELKEILERWENELQIFVDCSLMQLMQDIPDNILRKYGIWGCKPADLFCNITSSGDVYPCSFLTDDKFCAGNITRKSFKEIWYSQTFTQLRMNDKILRIPQCIN